MSELKPCPFCGSEPKRTDCIGCGYVQIMCPKCNANISIIIKDRNNPKPEADELIRRWNRKRIEEERKEEWQINA